MNRLISMILWISVVSCSAMGFREDAPSMNTSEAKDQTPSASDKDPSKKGASKPDNKSPASNASPESASADLESDASAPSPGSESHSDIKLPPGIVVIPVPVGGGSLTCNFDPMLGMQCQRGEFEGAQIFAPAYAMYASEVEKVWTKTTFKETNAGLYAVSLPPDLVASPLNVAIMVVDANNQALSDASFEIDHKIMNLVKNGSFEDEVINKENFAVSRTIERKNQNAWQSQKFDSDPLCVDQYELDGDWLKPQVTAAHGRQWMELIARCGTDLSDRKINIGIYQEVLLTKGRDYRISFAYRGSAEAANANTMRVNLDGRSKPDVLARNTEWKYQGIVFTATQERVGINFQEFGVGVARGTMIDDIVLVDLTGIKEQNTANGK
ncbi:MAG: hypothetical protein V4655_06605 [Bdellovibrionota bacterium]